MEELIIGKITSERKGKESQINKSKERKERAEGKLWCRRIKPRENRYNTGDDWQRESGRCKQT